MKSDELISALEAPPKLLKLGWIKAFLAAQGGSNVSHTACKSNDRHL
jgi:hypothetical protein